MNTQKEQVDLLTKDEMASSSLKGRVLYFWNLTNMPDKEVQESTL